MSECYILETDLFVGVEKDDAGIPFRYGFKHEDAIIPGYGGISKNTIKTGSTPTECKIFMLACGTGVLADDEEGGVIYLVDDPDATTPTAVTIYETIHMILQNDNEHIFKFDVIGTEYRLSDVRNSNDDVILDKEGGDEYLQTWMENNLNNTPTAKLKCYPTAP